jgi:biotin carboxyl carrier protein
MHYYVTVGKGAAAWRCEVRFEDTPDGLIARLSGDGAERVYRVDYCSLERGRALHLLLGGRGHDVYLTPVKGGFEVAYKAAIASVDLLDQREQLARAIHGAAQSGTREVRASMPGIVVRIDAQEGQAVADGTPLVVIEAMKMQNPMVAEGSGTVDRVCVAPGQAVAAGELLVVLR